jgi:hypothetical protein
VGWPHLLEREVEGGLLGGGMRIEGEMEDVFGVAGVGAGVLGGDPDEQVGLAGIEAAFVNVDVLQGGRGDPQCFGHQGGEGVFRVVQRKLEFGQANHGRRLVLIKQPAF